MNLSADSKLLFYKLKVLFEILLFLIKYMQFLLLMLIFYYCFNFKLKSDRNSLLFYKDKKLKNLFLFFYFKLLKLFNNFK